MTLVRYSPRSMRLGELNFASSTQEWNPTNFAQIHANRVVEAHRREVAIGDRGDGDTVAHADLDVILVVILDQVE